MFKVACIPDLALDDDELIGTLGNYNVHLLKEPVAQTGLEAAPFEKVLPHFDEITYTPMATRRLCSLIFSYQGLIDIDAMAEHVKQLLSGQQAGWCIGHATERTIVYVFKTGGRYLPCNFNFNDKVPTCYKLKKGGTMRHVAS